MNLSTSKILFKSLTISIIFTIIYLLFGAYQLQYSNLPLSIENISSLITMFNLAIFCAWFAFGIIGSVIILFVSIVATLFISAGIGSFYLIFNSFVFVFVFLAGYFLMRRIETLIRLREIEIDQLHEQFNTISEQVEHNKSLADGMQKRFSKYSMLKNIIEKFSSTLSFEEVITLTVDSCFELVENSDRCLLYWIDEPTQSLRLIGKRDDNNGILGKRKNGDVFNKWVLHHQQPLMIKDINKDFRFSIRDNDVKGLGFSSLITAPIFKERKFIGLIRLESSKVDFYTQDNLRFLDIIAGIASVTLNNALLYNRVEVLAITDGLTNLYLKRYFDSKLNELLNTKKNTTFSLVFIDIDNFKNYNDTFGHIAGDKVLVKVGMLLKQCVKNGIICRYGGEEFAIILCDTNKEKSAEIAERIRSSIEQEEFFIRREKTNLTVSIGIVNFPDEAKDKDGLIKIADERMYKAKKSGKNRVWVA